MPRLVTVEAETILDQHSHSWGVILVTHMTSTSMALGSLVDLGGEGE